MGSIPGPVLVIKVDQGQLVGSAQQAMSAVKTQAKQTADEVAASWKTMAAQIRASVASGVLPEKEILNTRQQLLGVLDKELASLRTRNELSTKQLSNLKAMTLEYERQKSHLSGTGGLTTGTSSALNQVSFQTTQGIERAIDSFVNRLFGGTAGALTRTVRDVGYYSAQASGNLSGNPLSNIGAGLSSLVETIGPSTLALTGMATALTAITVAAGSVTLSLARENEQFENLAHVTGLTSQQVQAFSELSKEMGLDLGGLTSSVDRFQAALGEYARKGAEGANTETGRTVNSLKQLGIAITDTQGKMRPAIDILSDFSDYLRAIPDAGRQSEIGLDTLGIRAKELLPYMLSAKGSLHDLLAEVTAGGPIIDTEMSAKLERAKGVWDDFTRSIDKAKLSFKEWVANGFLSATGLDQLGRPNFPAPIPKGNTSPLVPGQGLLIGSLGLDPLGTGSAAQNDALVKQSKIIAGETELQGQLAEKRSELSKAQSEHEGLLSVTLAKEVNSLELAVKAQEKRLEAAKKLTEEEQKYQDKLSTSIHFGREVQNHIAELIRNTGGVYGPFNVPGAGAPNIGGVPSIVSGDLKTQGNTIYDLIGQGSAKLNRFTGAGDLLKQINDEHEELFKTQRQKDTEHYQEELDDLNKALKQQLITQQQYSAAVKELTQDRNKTLEDLNKKYEEESNKLFDDLFLHKGKNFSKDLSQDLLNIAISPARKLFDQSFGSLFGTVNSGVQGSTSGISSFIARLFGLGGGSTAGGSGTTSGGFGGLFGNLFGIFGINQPGGTPGILPGGLGFGGGQGRAFSTQTMNVTAGIVAIGGGGIGGIGGGSGIGGDAGGIGNLLFSSQGISNANAYGGLGGGGLIGLALAGARALGLFSGGTSGVGNLPFTSQGISNAGGYAGLGGISLSGSASAAGQIPGLGAAGSGLLLGGAQIGGGLLLGLGHSTGGVAGAAEGAAGGALEGAASGFLLAGPIGAAIGGIVGGIAGLISGALGGPSFGQKVAKAMKDDQEHLPPSETFSFALGQSLSQTLSTGAAQSGNTFSQFALPSGTPFYASAITGALNKRQQEILTLEEGGLPSNQPFFGLPGTDPFTGQGGAPGQAFGKNGSPNINVQFNLPAMVDQNTISAVLAPHMTTIAQMIQKTLPSSAGGFGRAARAANNLP
jgi:hypothetical protein